MADITSSSITTDSNTWAKSEEKLYFKLDSQILESMDLCWQLYDYRMLQHFRPIEKAIALERGSVMHAMVAAYRRAKREGFSKEAHGAVVQNAILKGRVQAAGTTNVSVSMFEEEDIPTFQRWVLKWQYDGWEILDVEQPFSKVLYEDDVPVLVDSVLYPGLVIIYEGIIDCRAKDPKLGVVIVDSKTESRKSWTFVLNNQFQGYEWAFDGVPVIVDRIGYQTSLDDSERFRRLAQQSGGFAIDEWREDTVRKVKQSIAIIDGISRGERPPKNRSSCSKYATFANSKSGCDYTSVCKIPESSREFKLNAYFYKDRAWDPFTRDDAETGGEGGDNE